MPPSGTRSDSSYSNSNTKYKDTTADVKIKGDQKKGNKDLHLPDSITKLTQVISYLNQQLSLKGETTSIHSLIGLMNTDKSLLITSYARSWAQVIDGILYHDLIQVDTTLQVRLQNAIRLTNYFEGRFKQSTTIIPPKPLPWYDIGCIWTGRLAWLVAIVSLILGLIKSKLKFFL